MIATLDLCGSFFADEQWSVQDRYLMGKAIVEAVEAELDKLKPEVEKLKNGSYENKYVGKKLVVSSMNKGSLDDRKIAEELSVQELRLTYKATEKSLQAINRQDLIDKYKTVKEIKSVKVMKL